MAGPLEHIRILDLSRVRSGPTAVRQLSDWGADVIMIEVPESVEPGTGLAGPRHGPDFQNLHRGKRSLTLDLKAPAGRDVLLALVKNSDVVVENFRPDVKTRLGLDYETLSAINPRLVYASISGFGQDGPYAGRPGFDQIAQGMGGLMAVTGHPGQGPMRAGTAIADLSAGLFCAIGVLIALIERERSGKGQWVTASLLQAQIAMMDFQAARWLIGGDVPEQVGNGHPTCATMGVFRCRDGIINIASAGSGMWRILCRELGMTDLAENPAYADEDSRTRQRAALQERMELTLANDDCEAWIDRLNRAGIPAGPIYRMDQVFADPQVRHLGMAQTVTQSTLGEIKVVAPAFDLSRTPGTVGRGTPERGEHNEQILRGLGYDADRIEALRASGII